jgi:ArsR family transcriptional regulator, arsenate/arsenite/antimonite-responsive transcriptional repressor
METYTEKFKALSDETRLRIMHLLLKAEKGLCVCEFTDALEVPQYNVSRHLKILKNSGLIREQKEGRWVYFSLIKKEAGFINLLHQTIESIPQALLENDITELHKRLAIRTNGVCLTGIQKKHLINGQKI